MIRDVVSLSRRLLSRGGGTLSRLQGLHPAIDRGVRIARRELYLRRWFGAGPRRRGTSAGRCFVVINHCYDLDADAMCAADGAHTVWVFDAFQVFVDVMAFFPPHQRDLACVYGAGGMRESIDRYKAAFITGFARRLRRDTGLDALITPSDTSYYIRPLIEELHALGVPTIVQCKEGTLVSSAVTDDYMALLKARYPPIAEQFYLWNEDHEQFWRRVGVPEHRLRTLGQPRSDFFFHRDRWPSKASMGLSETKRLIVVFTYQANAYLSVDPKDRPWQDLRDDMHRSVIEFARERSDVEVVIKAHPQQADLAEVVAEFSVDPLPNVTLVTGAQRAHHLMVHADVIIGFQSTAMIEAMFTHKPLLYVGWGEHHDQLGDKLIPLFRSGGCEAPQTRTELDRMLRLAIDGGLPPSVEMMRARKAFTDRYFFNADGHASERILETAAEFIATRRAGGA